MCLKSHLALVARTAVSDLSITMSDSSDLDPEMDSKAIILETFDMFTLVKDK